MKTTRKHTVPAHDVDVPSYACDLCGSDLARHSVHDRDVLEFTARTYEPYAQTVTTERAEYDCCRECFEAKVAPALAALGLAVRRSEWE